LALLFWAAGKTRRVGLLEKRAKTSNLYIDYFFDSNYIVATKIEKNYENESN